MFLKFAATVAAMVVGTATFAATETFSFLGNYKGTYYSSISFTGDQGGNVDVTAKYVSGGKVYDAKVGQWNSNHYGVGGGLGVCNGTVKHGSYGQYCSGDAHTVDGYNKRDDDLKFSLDQHAVLTSVTFSNYGSDTDFRVYGNDIMNYLSFTNKPAHKWDNHAEWTGEIHAGAMFFIGAADKRTSFKVKSITVDYKMSEVPLPAAGFLLLGGLGGLAALKRRKKA